MAHPVVNELAAARGGLAPCAVDQVEHAATFGLSLGGCDDEDANCLPIFPGWNYMVRLHRPRPEILDGTWAFAEALPL